MMDHLRSHSDIFKYDDLVGVTILTSEVGKKVRNNLKAKFFDVFGFKDMDIFATKDVKRCDKLFNKIRIRIKSNKNKKFCFVYFILGQNVTQDDTGLFGARTDAAA